MVTVEGIKAATTATLLEGWIPKSYWKLEPPVAVVGTEPGQTKTLYANRMDSLTSRIQLAGRIGWWPMKDFDLVPQGA